MKTAETKYPEVAAIAVILADPEIPVADRVNAAAKLLKQKRRIGAAALDYLMKRAADDLNGDSCNPKTFLNGSAQTGALGTPSGEKLAWCCGDGAALRWGP